MIRLGKGAWIALEFKLADLWIGVFWDVRRCDYGSILGHVTKELHVWVCLVPCLPIHLIKSWEYRAIS